jgi:hypothetical protein
MLELLNHEASKELQAFCQSNSNSSLSSSDEEEGALELRKPYSAFKPVKSDVPNTTSVSAANSPSASPVNEPSDSTSDYSLLVPCLHQLNLLQQWSSILDKLPSSAKELIWSSCYSNPFFDPANDDESFEQTIKFWARDPKTHQASITILFTVLGVLKHAKLLSADLVGLPPKKRTLAQTLPPLKRSRVMAVSSLVM